MSKRPKNNQVKEPVQVYLAESDRTLLDELANDAGVSRAEVLRQAIRRLAADRIIDSRPGSSLDLIIGALGTDETIPTDLASRHHEYLYPAPEDDDTDSR